MDILVVLETKEGQLHRMSMEAITAAQSMAKELNLSTGALVMGGDVNTVSVEAAKLDIDEVLTVEHNLLSQYSADGYTEALKQIIEQEMPKYVVMGYTYQTRDWVPKVSARLQCPYISDVVSVKTDESTPAFSRMVYNGKLMSDILPKTDGPTLVSFQAASYPADGVAFGETNLRSVQVNLDDSMIRTTSEEPFMEEAGGVDLSAAEVVVSVGRGIGKEENIPLVESLAKALNAEVGSSRPIVDAGWLPTFRQVGSSGQSVAPKLYIALGISGAIQHIVGMKGSKNIIAINKDAEAPIFEIADFGVVGDVLEILPKLTEAVG